MSHSAMSTAAIAAPMIGSPGKTPARNITCHRCSLRNGSAPTRKGRRSASAPFTASGRERTPASPMPDRPSSVSTTTTSAVPPESGTSKAATSAIFMVSRGRERDGELDLGARRRGRQARREVRHVAREVDAAPAPRAGAAGDEEPAAAEGLRGVEGVDGDAVRTPGRLVADRVQPALTQVDELRGIEPVDAGRDRALVLDVLAGG